MSASAEIEVVEKVIERDGLCVGSFWCPPDSPLWRTENTIKRGPLFVFPMTAVEIEHPRTRPIVTHAARALFYNPGQPYRRRLLDEQTGDRCLFFAVSPQTVCEMLEHHGAPGGEDLDRPFEWSWGSSVPRLHLRAVEVYRAASVGALSLDAVHEEVLGLLDGVVGATSWLHRSQGCEVAVGRRALDAVDETLRELALRPDKTLTLAALGKRVGLSPFHLARAFRACTGTTVHECRDRLRVLRALDRLESSTRLVDLALDVGYSSHSHLTEAFRRVLGESPSVIKRRWRAPLAS